MNTDQIGQLCHSVHELSPKFGGVFFRDNLPDLAENTSSRVQHGSFVGTRGSLGVYTPQKGLRKISIRFVGQ